MDLDNGQHDVALVGVLGLVGAEADLRLSEASPVATLEMGAMQKSVMIPATYLVIGTNLLLALELSLLLITVVD